MNLGSGNTKTFIELASAGAVLVGLIFVGVELNQNTAAVQAATMQSITDSSQEYLLLLATDPELNRIWRLSNDDPDAMSESDRSQFFFVLRSQWLRYQNAFLHWQRGTMNDKDWALYEKFICDPNGSTTARAKKHFWSEHKPALLSEFVEFVEGCSDVASELKR